MTSSHRSAPDPRDQARLRAHWRLDPSIAFLNHGSFGACPEEVLAEQQRWRERMERQPVQFFVRDLEPLLDDARAALAAFLGADPQDVAFVPNATTGVSAVLRSLHFAAADELLTTNHAYNACRNNLDLAAATAGARVVVAEVPFPIASADDVVAAVLERVTPRTRLALLDHVTSPTALIFPIERLVRALAERGIETLVDGAHAPGMVPLNIADVGAAYYAGNCHKWLCAPKGVGFLYVRRDRQRAIRPTTLSHGANSPRTDRSRFLQEFDWIGTDDPTAYLCIPESLIFLSGLLPGGWSALMQHNHDLALAARRTICGALELPMPCPDAMIGALAAFPIADGSPGPASSMPHTDPLQAALLTHHRIEVPVVPWPAPPRRLLRISAQIYNCPADYARLAAALRTLLQE